MEEPQLKKSITLLGWLVALVALLVLPDRARAVYHLTVIDEVVTSYAGDAQKQLVQLRMLAIVQNVLNGSVLAAFDSRGQYLGDLLVVPDRVANAGPGIHWSVATEEFQSASGFTADFTMTGMHLPATGGMLCFGGGGGIAPKSPPDWDRNDFANYVDCVAYGTYSGPSNHLIGRATRETPIGHGIQRVRSRNDNASDFACGQPIIAINNTGAAVTLPATVPCSCGARERSLLRKFRSRP
jgi:hypothetical protein